MNFVGLMKRGGDLVYFLGSAFISFRCEGDLGKEGSQGVVKLSRSMMNCKAILCLKPAHDTLRYRYCTYVRVSTVLHMTVQPQHGTRIIISLTDADISITPKICRPLQPPRHTKRGDKAQSGVIISSLVLRISYVGLRCS